MQHAERIDKLRNATRYFYDLQKLRIQTGNRATRKAEHAAAALDDDDKQFLDTTSHGLADLEKTALTEVKRLLRGIPIYDQWLKNQTGCGPTMSAVLISEIHIEAAATASSLWSYCGLAPGQRRRRGERATYNPWLKSKVVKVLGDCLLRASSKDKTWRQHYDHYKHRKEHTLVDTCMACDGTGVAKYDDEGSAETMKKPARGERAETTKKPARGERAEQGATKRASATKGKRPCGQCNGTGGPAPWGRSAGHRHQAAIRRMVKEFLKQLHCEWRTLEGLPVPPSYAEAMLDRVHGDHGGAGPAVGAKTESRKRKPHKAA